MYNLETLGRPGISMLGGNDPACVRVLEAFHKSLGRPECELSFGDSFVLNIAKGQSIKQALTLAAEDLQHPDSFANQSLDGVLKSAREHVPALLANL